jgi:hypothetical protein
MENAPHEWLKAMPMLAPKDYTDTAPVVATEALVIDTKGYEDLFVVLNVGVVAGTGIAVKVQEDDASDGGTAVDVASATFTTLTAANDVDMYVGRVKLRGRKRYLLLAFTFTAVTASNLSATAILSNARVYPVTQKNTVAFAV